MSFHIKHMKMIVKKAHTHVINKFEFLDKDEFHNNLKIVFIE